MPSSDSAGHGFLFIRRTHIPPENRNPSPTATTAQTTYLSVFCTIYTLCLIGVGLGWEQRAGAQGNRLLFGLAAVGQDCQGGGKTDGARYVSYWGGMSES